MGNASATLNDLIELLHDGEKFYAEAAEKVKTPAYQSLFQRMARTKQAIAADLAVHVAAHGEKASNDGTLAGTMRKAYTEVRAKLGKDAEAVYVAQLEQTEDRILEAFRDQLSSDSSVEVRGVVERYYPEVKRAHDEMRELKHRLAA